MSDKPKTTRFRRKDTRPEVPQLEGTGTPEQEPAARAAQAPAPAVAAREPAPQLDRDDLADLAGMDADDFARAFAQAMGETTIRPSLRVGETVDGRVVRITPADVFVDIGAKSEASIASSELADASGELSVKIGDVITASVLSTRGGELRLSKRLRGGAARDMLEAAYEAGIPLDGRVSERNPGGFIIDLGGARGFCPVSQIDRFPGEDLDRFIGLSLPFRVQELRGGEAVVSHRVIQEENVEAQAENLWATIKPGDEHEGVVRSVQPFGAFVDIGGVDGLVHRSELSWEDVSDPNMVVSRGQRVRVRVLEIDREAKRLSLTLKDNAADPWALLGRDFLQGEVYTATIRRLADFGAFADLAPGITGLIHVANLADQRVEHPRDVVSEGQQIQVRVLSIDLERKRLDLGARQARADWSPEDRDERRPRHEPAQTSAPASGGFGTMADLLKGLKLD